MEAHLVPARVDQRWWGWGDPPSSDPGVALALTAVREALGETQEIPAAVPLERTAPPPSRLAPRVRDALARQAEVDESAPARVRAAYGSAYADLVRRRRGEATPAPDAVVRPGNGEGLQALLRVCAEHDVAVVPRGGGTTMSGGVDASGGGERAALIALDMRSMARLVDIDAISLRATFQAGIGGSALDAALAPLGLTVGHQPESFERSTLGGWIAARSIGQASGPAGAVSAVVRAARVATPVGVLETGGAPAQSEGPDLLELVTGSEGVLGAIEQATVLVRPRPEAQTGSALLFRSSADALVVVRLLAQEGTLPEIALLLDETETATLGRPLLAPAESGRRQIGTRGAERGALLVLIGSGSARVVGAEIDAAVESCLAHGATDIGQEPARRWLHTRYVGPYLRDALIDAGYACEWISTAATWGTLPAVRDAVVAALTDTLGARSLVSCRLTNAYPDGAGLRFTYVAPVAPGGEIELWRRAQAAAFGAILAEGGAISHGQAIGTHQARWLARARGRTAEGVLMAAKNELDPLGIMNPGKLLHEAI